MSIIEKLKPAFLEYRVPKEGPLKDTFNFRKIWKIAILLTAAVTLIPLIAITIIDYNVTQKSLESEILLRTSRVASNTKRSISFSLINRQSALDFIIQDNSFKELNDVHRLTTILTNLKSSFGEFVDIGVINEEGIQTTYVGDYNLEGKNYSAQSSFQKVVEQGMYISDVFMGFRNKPHFVIALKYTNEDDSFYVLRTTIDTDHFGDLLSNLELSGMGDAFIINHEGIIQTSSRIHGNVLEKISMPVPEYSERTMAMEYTDKKNKTSIVAYSYIPDTKFILMIIKDKTALMKSWRATKSILILFLAGSITIILAVILSMTTFLVNNMYYADKKRSQAMHRIEYDNKLATIGRLAAGVAHEINNPLAIINEKAGLIKDMFTYQNKYSDDQRLIGLVDSIISSVSRCGSITHRLLSFARHMEVSIQSVDIKKLITDVLGFMGKEAEYRSIQIIIDIPDNLPFMECDRGKMQQIFLNLINNAFAAMGSEGVLKIEAKEKDKDFCTITVTDNGCGIAENDLNLIFEPFFTKKSDQGGTGLGLSITYRLIEEAGGYIKVKSEMGKGTSFMVTLPYLHKTGKEEKTCEYS